MSSANFSDKAALQFSVFESQSEMTEQSLALIEGQLKKSLQLKDRALIAVSGGSSPAPLYKDLSKLDIDWARVDIVLVDERWVNPWEEGSNEAFIQETLIQNNASIVELTGLKTNDESPINALPEIERKLSSLSDNIDIAIMGIGPDAHTASWFPRAKNLDLALDMNSGHKVCAIQANKSAVTGGYLDRITLTLPFISASSLTLLLISGEAKRSAFDAAIMSNVSEHDYPVRALIEHSSNLEIFWTP